MKKFVFIFLMTACALAQTMPTGFAQKPKGKATAAAPASAAHGNADYITEAQLKDYLYFIASDEMAGRNTPSKELDLTAKFLALNLSRWGLRPAGDDGTFFQHVTLKRSAIDPAQTRAELSGQPLSYGDDFYAAPQAGTASGNLVFAGHGWVIKSKNINAYQTADSELNVKDKIVVVYSGAVPQGVNRGELARLPASDRISPMEYALSHGAKGLITIPSPMQISTWQQRVQAASQLSRWNIDDPAQKALPAIVASEKMVRAIFAGERIDGDTILKKAAKGEFNDAFELSAAKQVGFTIGVKSETTKTQNVVAILEGSDAALKNEYVAIGAHYDHVGSSPQTGCSPASGDTICNGADDDGSGTTAVLALAEAFSHGPRPKRSILFVWHCGEEKGLWGSEYFTDHPTVPLSQIITQLNIDMIGRSRKPDDNTPANSGLTGPHEIYVIGSKMMSTELGNLSEAVNNNFLKLAFNYKYDEPNDPQRLFYRSDHYNYARKGIPIIFYFDGIHEDYHRPSDEPQKIDYEKMMKVTRTVYATAWALGNAAKRPAVDKQLPAALAGN
ncbi:MAG TPA: M28 family peptidase [Blastocatellia bacterium]|nr:M28 family peptidase [Blastocatellia bacterium]